MDDSRISLRDPRFAALLAFLVPGLGHLYQGRFFKGLIYMVCILGTFAYGMHLGEWRCVYMHTPSEVAGRKPQLVWGYLAQVGIGLPALPAIMQSRRYHSPANQQVQMLEEPLTDVECTGMMSDPHGVHKTRVSGQITIDGYGEGRFVGTTESGEEVDLRLGGFNSYDGFPVLDPKVASSPKRKMAMRIVDGSGESAMITGRLQAEVPRSFFDWYQVPPSKADLGEMHRMGKIFDLAQVFTWVAGLLNILAIWDAFDGPAYGYGDEEEKENEQEKEKRQPKDKQPAQAAAAKPQPEPAS